MDFKKLLLIGASLLMLAACTEGPFESDGGNLIGEELSQISSLSTRSDENPGVVVLFDETTRRIHKFNLGKMKHKESYKVEHPGEDHYVLYDDGGSYVIDLTKKHLAIFDKDGNQQLDPIRFQGEPISAAFHANLGYLVIYDDLGTVGLVMLDDEGRVVKARAIGPVFPSDASISAGDISDDGKLILSLSDDTISVVDIGETIDQSKWVEASQATALTEISWVSTIRGEPNQVFVKSKGKLSLIDVDTQAVLGEYIIEDATTSNTLHKLSKALDPHALVRRGSDDEMLDLVYVEAGAIKTRTVFHAERYFMASFLNQNTGLWNYVSSPKSESTWTWSNNIDVVKVERKLRSYDIGSMMANYDRTLPDQAQLRLGQQYLFALFPSELGYAVRYGLSDEDVKEVKSFNLKIIKKSTR